MPSQPDYRIDADEVSGAGDGAFCWAIIAKAWPDADEPDVSVKFFHATKGQRAILAVTLCQRDVDNGGFEQFFQNEAGNITADVIDGFELLGLADRARLVRRAGAFFPISVEIKDQRSRCDFLERIAAADRNVFFEPLDQEFYVQSEPKLWPYFRAYVNQYPEEFFR